MNHYSALSIVKKGLTGNRIWARVWRDVVPKPADDIVLDKGGLGDGNAGRNTTIVRSNYRMPGNTLSYERLMEL
ncbi:FAD-binding oxidoreductase [Primorskyibacter flagellatus]|uniref:Uncharacterized protein n=1 Tax=Primorskyibacter flagellatus TaxID=1387277 RepID=A0A1W2EEQ3_9RHOB|nr:FAD-binding oxidoreductase [Primorskyibacter flagellatus]SMD07872.1 hypothetical protein SAMN06295998_1272 [Primorskyibacter flagellatus]